MNEVKIRVQLWRRGFHSDVLITEQKAVQTAKDIFMNFKLMELPQKTDDFKEIFN